jgi:hypothetical protein
MMGELGTIQTMQMMRRLVLESLSSQRVCKIAAMLWSSGIKKSSMLETVDQYIRAKFVYSDEEIETLLTPDYMLQGLQATGRLVGDCDDIAILHSAILTCLDFKTRFVAIRSTLNDPNYDHVYIEADDHGTWKPYDATVPVGTNYEVFGQVIINV